MPAFFTSHKILRSAGLFPAQITVLLDLTDVHSKSDTPRQKAGCFLPGGAVFGQGIYSLLIRYTDYDNILFVVHHLSHCLVHIRL